MKKDLRDIDIDELKNLFHITEINSKRNYWLIRAGKKGAFFNEFFTRGFTGIAISELDNSIDEFNKMNIEDLKHKIIQKYPEEKQPGHLAGKIYNFIHEIKIGDIVIMPSSGREKVAFGKIISEPYIDSSLVLEESIKKLDDQEIPNKRRKVEWLKIKESENLPAKLILNLFSPHGLSAITDREVIELIDLNLNNTFIKNERTYMVFKINTKKNIDINDISSLFEEIDKVISFTKDYFNINDKVSTKINLNSPGNVVIITSIPLLCLTAIIFAIIGGEFKIDFYKLNIHIKSKGIKPFIETWLKYKKEMKILDNTKHKDDLKLEEPELFKEIQEDILISKTNKNTKTNN